MLLQSDKVTKTLLASAVSILLSQNSTAAEFNVTENTDDGTGLVENTLSWAILQANTVAGDDTIILNTSLVVTGVMKRLINSNVTISSDFQTRTIDGDERFRPLFIKSGSVVIDGVNITKGHARGGAKHSWNDAGGGGGAGMGGALFIYSGNVTLSNAVIQNSVTSTSETYFSRSGGGMYGTGSGNSGGSLFESAEFENSNRVYGGYGNYDNVNTTFGKSGGLNDGINDGGFGGGGSYGSNQSGGKGGFGGGGGYSQWSSGGDGGFGGGSGGLSQAASGSPGVPGYGAEGRNAASMGGAIFIRSGVLNLENVVLEFNQSIATNGAKGLGGGLFILHTTTQENGNNEGMPFDLPIVNGCDVVFIGNGASGDPNTSNNNDDLFDVAGIYNEFDCANNLIFKNSFE